MAIEWAVGFIGISMHVCALWQSNRLLHVSLKKSFQKHSTTIDFSCKTLLSVEDDLHQMYDVKFNETMRLKCLSPQAMDHWQKLGRCSFQDFFCCCIAARCSMRKQLSLFKRAWAALEKIFKLNANEKLMCKYSSISQRLLHVGASVGERRFRGYLEHQVTDSWPNVRVLVLSEHVCATHSFSFCS
jgi:hypothetical protein